MSPKTISPAALADSKHSACAPCCLLTWGSGQNGAGLWGTCIFTVGVTSLVRVPEHGWQLSHQSVPMLVPASPKLWGLPGSCHTPPYCCDSSMQNSPVLILKTPSPWPLSMSLCPVSSSAFPVTSNHKGFPSPELWPGPQTTRGLLHCLGMCGLSDRCAGEGVAPSPG